MHDSTRWSKGPIPATPGFPFTFGEYLLTQSVYPLGCTHVLTPYKMTSAAEPSNAAYSLYHAQARVGIENVTDKGEDELPEASGLDRSVCNPPQYRDGRQRYGSCREEGDMEMCLREGLPAFDDASWQEEIKQKVMNSKDWGYSSEDEEGNEEEDKEEDDEEDGEGGKE
ncbi:hypothetical protein BDK51DRAFT_38723 [Blyttiomyces helicus]|uniref:Uncharacterized protein n=1 Tax=Blyttiomyces helicus TaxID=388810 RepID=A0A4V1IQR8_9FUNG|nr:hypothetical protein BDK51DRAFT_38723 [Blyttiomyces helicus]|eukprot:RKO87507.1 hypothetical protein BDK51DRAFT_38723 [Blyttiomyces helicus]